MKPDEQQGRAPVDESERDRIMRLRGPVERGERVYVEGTSDSTHCEPCNGGCPDLCRGWAHRNERGGLKPCATDADRRRLLADIAKRVHPGEMQET